MAGGGAAVAAAAAIAQAIKASGAIVELKPEEFIKILSRAEEPVVITSREKGLFGTTFKYMTSYKGFFFFTKSKTALEFAQKNEFVQAKSIWIPGNV